MTDATTSRTSVPLVRGVGPDAASFSCLLTSAPDAVGVILHNCAYPVIPRRQGRPLPAEGNRPSTRPKLAREPERRPRVLSCGGTPDAAGSSDLTPKRGK